MPALVDVVIPVFGHPEILTKCLSHLRAQTCPTMDVILVDDKSPDFNVMRPVYISYKVLKNGANMGFPQTANAGASKGKAPLVLLLNTDVFLEPSAVDEMVHVMDDPSVGVVGPLLTFAEESKYGPAGKVQHAGMALDITGKPFHLHIGWSPNNPRVQRQREVQFVTGACLMTRRALWNTIGGLESCYGRGTYEDTEYCYRVNAMGLKVVYCPTACGAHMVGGSEQPFPISYNYQQFRMRCKAQWFEYKLW